MFVGSSTEINRQLNWSTEWKIFLNTWRARECPCTPQLLIQSKKKKKSTDNGSAHVQRKSNKWSTMQYSARERECMFECAIWSVSTHRVLPLYAFRNCCFLTYPTNSCFDQIYLQASKQTNKTKNHHRIFALLRSINDKTKQYAVVWPTKSPWSIFRIPTKV